MITTPLGPEFVKNDDQSGAKPGDHTQIPDQQESSRPYLATQLQALTGQRIVIRNCKPVITDAAA